MRAAVVLAVCTALISLPAFAQTSPMAECSSLGASAPKMQTKMVLEDYYPEMSIHLGEQGATVVSFAVLKNGTVTDAQIMQSSGSARLDSATVLAMQQMLYSQPMSNGVPVDCRGRLRLVWKLNGDERLSEQDFPVLKPPLSAYPPKALQERREGAVLLYVLVKASGEVGARVQRSSGSDDLDLAAMNLVASHKFTPAQMDGAQASSIVGLIVDWELGASQPADRKSK